MKVFIPAIEGHVPPGIVRTISAFLDFCYYVRRNSLNESALESLQDALECFHDHRRIFQETGVHQHGPKGFSLPRQHSMNHYRHLIQEFGVPNGLCSSITESKHIKVVKKPWRRSNRFDVLGQMLVTNQHLDKLAAARVDFENRQMLQGSVISAAMDEVELHRKRGQNTCNLDTGAQRVHRDNVSRTQCHNGDEDKDYSSDGSDDEAQIHNGPCVLNYVRLAKTPGKSAIWWCCVWLILSRSHATARKYPSSLYTLAHHIQQPKLPLLTRRFLHFQLQNNVDPSNDNVVLPDLSGLPFSIFHSATSTFYAPSDLSGLGGMHSECIWSTPSW